MKVIEEMARKLGDMYEKLLLPETIVTLTELIEGLHFTLFYCCKTLD